MWNAPVKVKLRGCTGGNDLEIALTVDDPGLSLTNITVKCSLKPDLEEDVLIVESPLKRYTVRDTSMELSCRTNAPYRFSVQLESRFDCQLAPRLLRGGRMTFIPMPHAVDAFEGVIELNKTENAYRARITKCDNARRLGREYQEGAGRYGYYTNCQRPESCPIRWEDCYENQKEWEKRGAMPSFSLTIGIEEGFLARYMSNTLCIRDVIGTIADANELIYHPQIGIHINVVMILLPEALTSIQPQLGSCETGGTGVKIKEKLDHAMAIGRGENLARFEKVTGRQLTALWHIYTDCYTLRMDLSIESFLRTDPDAIGFAGVGSVCMSTAGAVSTYDVHGKMWKTVAHEIGHQFAAEHSFGLGGIMDYGSGLLTGYSSFILSAKEKFVRS